MTVYVDPARVRYRGVLYCHVWADSLDELHTAVGKVGMPHAWFQAPPKASWPHYDAGPKFRALLVWAGAVETDKYGAAEHEARRKGDRATLARIAVLRVRQPEAVA